MTGSRVQADKRERRNKVFFMGTREVMPLPFPRRSFYLIPDGPDAPVDAVFAAIRRIATAVDVPVTADLLARPAIGMVSRCSTAGV